MEYNKENPLRIVTLCSGYDSQCLALNRLKENFPLFDYDLIAWSEFDPESKSPLEKQPAVIAHNALFPQWADRNLGDMTKIDWEKVPDFDFLFYSTPCQSISAAGLQHGFAEGSGTRSSIIWNVRDAVRIKRPKYLCLENVKNMVSKKFVGMFNLWQQELERLGYVNFAQVLNAKDYGVPQNRERIFLVSIRIDDLEGIAGNIRYHFPKPFPLRRRLKDVLEEHVDEKYYLSDKMLESFYKTDADKSHCHNFIRGLNLRLLFMKKCRLRITKGVDVSKVFSASIHGGIRGFEDALALETHSNEIFPAIRTMSGFTVIVEVYEAKDTASHT